MTMQRKQVRLLKELEQLKHLSAKSTAANKFTTKYKKRCQILWLLRKREKYKSDKSYTRYARGIFKYL